MLVSVDQTPVPATAFSEVQITQLQSLMSAPILNERAGLQQPPGLAVGLLLSPATQQPQPPSAAVQTGLQHAQPSQSSFADYGKTEMNVIGEQFLTSLPNKDRAIRKEKLQAEHGKFKYDLASWKAKIPPECQSNTERPPEITAMTWSLQKLAKMGHFCEELSFVAEIILLAPVTNAGPERGASALKRVNARLRSKLGNDMMFSLMHITINGPENGTPESREMVEQAYEDWKSAKIRRYRSGPILNTPASSTQHEPPCQVLPCVEMSDAGVRMEVESLGTSSATQPLTAAISETETLSILQLDDITDAECDTENDRL